MSKELNKRIVTSLLLISLLIAAIYHSYVLIISLILISIISWIEINALFSKIFTKKNLKTNFLKLLVKVFCLIYLCFFSVSIFNGISDQIMKYNTIYLICICICSDIGGLVFGKFFGGKKLTKISPNKTIAGSIGSFTLSLILIPFFINLFENNFDIISLTLITVAISFLCQLGDLLISYLKRKANVKNTGDLLPGHGGVLDRIDGILFAVPFGLIIMSYF